MLIDTILLDVGGVLVQTVDTSKRRVWEERLGLSAGQLTNEIYSIEPADFATVGLTTDEIVWSDIQKRFALSVEDLGQLKLDFFAGDQLNIEFYSYMLALKDKFRISLFTNAWGNARKVYAEKYHLDKITTEMIISAEAGLEKPDIKFYELALGHMNTLAERTLFIDDTHENIKSAKELGIHSVQFKTTEQAIEEINSYLLKRTVIK